MNALCLPFQVQPYASIEAACQQAVELANRFSVMVTFEHSGNPVYASPGDNWQLLAIAWENAHRLGPNHVATAKR